MSTMVNHAPTTIQEQSAQATRELCHALGIEGVKPGDLKLLTIALARATTDEAQRNGEFRDRIVQLFQSLKPAPASKKASAKAPAERHSGEKQGRLKVIGTVPRSDFDPYAPPDPWELQQLFGNDQLARMLNGYAVASLKQALPRVMERYPHTKPTKMTKAGIVDYILTQVMSDNS